MLCPCLAAAILFSVAKLRAEELKSGPQTGEQLAAFTVEKCAGNENDGVAKGEKLCYRCMLGNRPVVAVFARTPDSSLATLVKELDAIVAKHEKEKLASFVNLLGKDAEKLKGEAETLVKKSGAKNIAVVVPADHEKGPEEYKLNPKADLTILVYNQGKVEANFALPSGGLKKEVIEKIKESTLEMLN
jgi:hypothetical protein